MTDAFMYQHGPWWVHSALFWALSFCRQIVGSPARQNELWTRKTILAPVEHGCPSVRASMGHFTRTSLALERKGEEAFEPTGSV